ncbi:unnamed protein product [Closterium sp. NIES-54]
MLDLSDIVYSNCPPTLAGSPVIAVLSPASCATVASLRVLAFDQEGRPVAFDTWHDDLQLYLLSDLKDSVSLFNHVSGAARAPPATANVLFATSEPHRPTEPRRPTEPHCPACPTASAAIAATVGTAAMASPTILTFDVEGRAVDFDVWVDDLQLFLQCDSRDGVSLFNHTSGVSTAPAATADSTVRSQWTTRDAVARLAVRSHLLPAERPHFGQYKTAKSLYDAVVARYSSPATAAFSRLMLPYLFPDLAAFATVADLIAHLRTSDARYRAALPTDFCAKNPPPPCSVLRATRPLLMAPQTLHMDVWGPARVRGQGHERYFLLVVDDYSRYTTVFPLRSKGEVPKVLIDWIRGTRRQLSESFGSDLRVLRLHSDRGGEFSSDLLRAFCRAEGIRQTFTLPASP